MSRLLRLMVRMNAPRLFYMIDLRKAIMAESLSQKHAQAENIHSLSVRLKKIYDLILPNQPLWDIGCDHGYVGLHAYRNRLCTEVNLVDQSREVLHSTYRRIAEWFPERTGEGLRVWCLDAGREALPISSGTVVMAGLGTGTIARMIVNLFPEKLPVEVRLVLASTFTGERLRLELLRWGWRLQHEELYPENGHVRQILACGTEGEIIHPFWNRSSISADNGLLEAFLKERRQYFSVCQSRMPDLLYLKKSLISKFGI
jgi:tRNA (adenine22-N1)-methyltransferase